MVINLHWGSQPKQFVLVKRCSKVEQISHSISKYTNSQLLNCQSLLELLYVNPMSPLNQPAA